MADKTIYVGADDSANGDNKKMYTGTLRLQKCLYQQFESEANKIISKYANGKNIINPPNLHFVKIKKQSQAKISSEIIDFILSQEKGWKLQIIDQRTQNICGIELLCKNIAGAISLYIKNATSVRPSELVVNVFIDGVKCQPLFKNHFYTTIARILNKKPDFQVKNIHISNIKLLNYITDNIISSIRSVLSNTCRTSDSYKYKKIVVEKIIEKLKCHPTKKNEYDNGSGSVTFAIYSSDDNERNFFDNEKGCDIMRNTEFCDKNCPKLNK